MLTIPLEKYAALLSVIGDKNGISRVITEISNTYPFNCEREYDVFISSPGWVNRKGKYPYPNSHENINDEGIFVLPEKFSAAKSRSLTTAIKELESLVKAGIEDQVAEEQSESKKLPDQQTGAEIVAGGGR